MKKTLRSTFGTLVVAAFLVLTPPIYAKGGHGGHGGHGKHGKHFSSVSQRGGHAFSRGGSKFSRAKSGKAYRSWGGRKWSRGYRAGRAWNGGYWNGGNWGWYPYWGWRYPYSYSYYSYYPYWYYPSYGYKYDDCSVSRRRYFFP